MIDNENYVAHNQTPSSAIRTPGPPIRCALTSKCKKLRSAQPRVHHGPPQYLDHLWDALCHVNAKNYGAHNLESIIGHPAHLDHLLDVHWHLNAKSYGAHNLDSIFGHSEHLDHWVEWVPIPRAKNLRCTPRLHHRPPWIPRPRVRSFPTPKITDLLANRSIISWRN